MPYSQEMAMELIGSKYVKLGKDLVPDDQERVKSAFVYRFTGDHIPEWSRKKMENGQEYKRQFVNDREWLNETWFAVNQQGRWDSRVVLCCSKMPVVKVEGSEDGGTGRAED